MFFFFYSCMPTSRIVRISLTFLSSEPFCARSEQELGKDLLRQADTIALPWTVCTRIGMQLKNTPLVQREPKWLCMVKQHLFNSNVSKMVSMESPSFEYWNFNQFLSFNFLILFAIPTLTFQFTPICKLKWITTSRRPDLEEIHFHLNWIKHSIESEIIKIQSKR